MRVRESRSCGLSLEEGLAAKDVENLRRGHDADARDLLEVGQVLVRASQLLPAGKQGKFQVGDTPNVAIHCDECEVPHERGGGDQGIDCRRTLTVGSGWPAWPRLIAGGGRGKCVRESLNCRPKLEEVLGAKEGEKPARRCFHWA